MKTDNTLHSGKSLNPPYFIPWGETGEQSMRHNIGEYFFFKAQSNLFALHDFNTEMKGNC